MPTPPAAPLMSSRSPAPSPHWVKRASCEVVNASAKPAGLEGPEGVRHRHGRPLVHDRQLGLPATADDGHDPVTHAEALDAGPDRSHHAGKLEAGMSAGESPAEPGTRRLAAAGPLRSGRRPGL